jgi:23S rRNA G2445 N2-methylase RlmL
VVRVIKPMPADAVLERLRDPGFTPRLREVDALVELLVDEEHAKAAARAIARVGPGALVPLRARFEAAVSPLRAHVLAAIGRFPEEAAAVEVLLAALTDADPKTRRNAAIALGHVTDAARVGVEDALLAAWDADPRPPMRRTLAASLGKVGTARALPLLREAARSEDDAELARVAERARTMLERTTSRGTPSRVASHRPAPRPVELRVLSRRGLEETLAGELAAIAAVVDVRVAGSGVVHARLAGAIDALFAARTMLSFGFPLPPEARRGSEPSSETIARAATSDAARAIFATWTEGAARYRIAWTDGGHQRSATWDTARAIAARAAERGLDLVNDPTASTWELVVARADDAVDLTLEPRALVDPRFAWRRGDVPAASHPTIAAALARIAGVRADDVVWDPFAGSGAELIERAMLGPYRALHGSDVDSRALDVARENLAAAGVTAALEVRDVLAGAPAGVTLVVTNPPMGRRAARTPGLDATLDRFVVHAGTSLVPGGRLVWLAPWPKRSRAAAASAGLSLDGARMVDMGGFDAELQRWVK